MTELFKTVHIRLTAVSILTVLWKLKEDRAAGCWSAAGGALIGALGATLIVPPVFCGVALLTCSFILLCVTKTRAELLPVESRAVLITGCDSGFGHALAKRLSDAGVKVFAGVLDVTGAGAQQLRERGSENLQVLQLDVTDSSQIETAHRYVCAQVADTGLWGLVNNAGVLHWPVDAELNAFRVYRSSMDVNFLSAVKMTQLFLPLLRRSRGRIVNVSSIAGEMPMPMFSAYGASKAALNIFSKVLRLELSVWGVKVAIIQPVGFRTKILGNTDSARQRAEILEAVSSDAREDYGEAYISSLFSSLSQVFQGLSEDLSPVVDNMCHALLSVHPKPLYTPGRMGWVLQFLHRCCPPAVFDTILLTILPKYTPCEPVGLKRS